MIGRLLFGFCITVAFSAPALSELAMTGAPATMRAGPTGAAPIVQRIPKNAEVEVLKCRRGWCRASWRSRLGYIPADAMVLGPPPATLPGDEMPPPLVYAQPTYVTPPVWRWQGPYVGTNFGFGQGGW
jgi:SH3 domain-containing protein